MENTEEIDRLLRDPEATLSREQMRWCIFDAPNIETTFNLFAKNGFADTVPNDIVDEMVSFFAHSKVDVLNNNPEAFDRAFKAANIGAFLMMSLPERRLTNDRLTSLFQNCDCDNIQKVKLMGAFAKRATGFKLFNEHLMEMANELHDRIHQHPNWGQKQYVDTSELLHGLVMSIQAKRLLNGVTEPHAKKASNGL